MMTYTTPNGGKIEFDDYKIDYDFENNVWTQMCRECYNKYRRHVETRVDDAGEGICGVAGCYNEADYYIDFDISEVKFK